MGNSVGWREAGCISAFLLCLLPVTGRGNPGTGTYSCGTSADVAGSEAGRVGRVTGVLGAVEVRPIVRSSEGCGRCPILPGRTGFGTGDLPACGRDSPLQEKPDLTVLDTWTVPGTFCPQAVVDLHSTIHNLGTVAVVDSFFFDMWFDGDRIGYARIDSLGAGATLELVLESFAWPADSDTHAVTAMADTDQEIDEDVEVNNIHLEYFLAERCTTCTEVSLPFDTGWNWFSLNVDDADMSLDHVLSSLDSNGVYVKNQVAFAEYVPDWSGWFGTLTEISCHETYMIKMGNTDTLDFCGFPYDVSTPLELPSGWSWISYLPRDTMTVDEALGSLGDSGEFIKNQTAFAEYVPDWNGWFGALSEMRPYEGYKIKMAAADTLVYPDSAGLVSRSSPNSPVEACRDRCVGDWTVDPHLYESNSCLIAEVRLNGEPCVGAGDRLGVFREGECRGVARAIPGVEGNRLFYLSFYGLQGVGEVLTFKYESFRDGVVYAVAEEIGFSPDLVLGTSRRPFVLNACPELRKAEVRHLRVFSLTNRPDPFRESTNVKFRIGSPGAVTVAIYDIRGKAVVTLLEASLEPGVYTVLWDGTAGSHRAAPSGVYFCRLAAGEVVLTEKMVLMN